MAKNEITKTENTALSTEGMLSKFVTKADPNRVKELLTKDDSHSLEIVYTLQSGEQIEGIFVGPGAAIMMDDLAGRKDPATGEVAKLPVKTWRIKSEGVNAIVNLIGAAQLDSRLGSIQEGTSVLIQHLGKVTTRKNMQANNYLVITGPVDRRYIRQLSLPSAS